ncbi:MAG: 4'-phosphopantetheinyl transferase superfamily protein [Prevotella sp.]|nr:4'-phosphopantetheinyl transferase superfamily protein [Prevotella sp.]
MIYINDRLFDFDLDAALAELSEQRREQALRYRHELGRRTCAAAYLLLCEGLRKEYGIVEKPIFEYGEHGKPSIVGRPDIHFSLSHCREAAICVVSDRPVGVDVESVHRYNERLARYTMNDEEMAEILAAESPDLAFTRLWTQKEALLKCTGEGIGNDLKDVLKNYKKSPSPSGEGNGVRLSTVESPDDRYVYSVCQINRL